MGGPRLCALMLLAAVGASAARSGPEPELCRQPSETPAPFPYPEAPSHSDDQGSAGTSSPPSSCTSGRSSSSRAVVALPKATTAAEGTTRSQVLGLVHWDYFWFFILVVVPLIFCGCLSCLTFDIWTWLSTHSLWTGRTASAEPLLPPESASSTDSRLYGTCPHPDPPSSDTEASPSSGTLDEEYIPLADTVPAAAIPDPALEAETSL